MVVVKVIHTCPVYQIKPRGVYRYVLVLTAIKLIPCLYLLKNETNFANSSKRAIYTCLFYPCIIFAQIFKLVFNHHQSEYISPQPAFWLLHATAEAVAL